MRSFVKGAFSLFFVLCYAFAIGQKATAPVINCVSANESPGDVDIDFTPTALNPCGKFDEYDIFGSQAGGPYHYVGSQPDSNVLSFKHVGANASNTNQWCYKVIVKRACTGIDSTSDTSVPVCSQVLNIPQFTYVTVTPAGVQVNWSATVSPAVHHFVIYYKDPTTGLYISLDTVSSSTFSYLDTHNNAGSSYITYSLKALDSCFNQSNLDSIQSTIFMDAKSNPCLQTTSIGFNPYQKWPGDVAKEYMLETVIDNGAPVDTGLGQPFPVGAPPTQRQSIDFSIAGLTGNNICFTIIATSPDGKYQSRSNQVCMPLNVLHSTQFIYSSYASVLDSSALTYSWMIDTTAQIDSFYIRRSADGQNFNLVKTQAAGSNKVFELTFNDSSANPNSGSFYYEVESVDTCGYQLTSNTVQTIFLTATSPSAAVNHLSWNAFELSNASVLNYTIYRIRSDGTVIAAATVLPNVFTYDDQVGDAISDNGVFCYRIVANYVLNIPTLSISKTYTTHSNDVCVTKDPVVWIPNAFVPAGVNSTFRPVFLFGVSEYDFRIFDRWGKEVFATQDIVAGWDGNYRGEKLPLGGYVYQLKATSATGDVIERHGVVALVR